MTRARSQPAREAKRTARARKARVRNHPPLRSVVTGGALLKIAKAAPPFFLEPAAEFVVVVLDQVNTSAVQIARLGDFSSSTRTFHGALGEAFDDLTVPLGAIAIEATNDGNRFGASHPVLPQGLGPTQREFGPISGRAVEPQLNRNLLVPANIKNGYNCIAYQVEDRIVRHILPLVLLGFR